MKIRYSNFGRNIMALNKYFKFYFKSALREYDLNSTEGMVLLVLYCSDGQTEEGILENIHNGQTQDQLISELHCDKAAMTRTMQALEKKGFVLRRDNPLDSRSFLFVLTDKAKEFKTVLFDTLRKWNDGVLQGLDQQTIAILESSLDCMMKNAMKLAKDMKQYSKGQASVYEQQTNQGFR